MAQSKARVAGERGAVALVVALVLTPVLLAGVALAVETARWAAVHARLQRIADAAALAAAPLWSADRAAAQTAGQRAAAAGDPPPGTRIELLPGPAADTVRAIARADVPLTIGSMLGPRMVALDRTAVAAYTRPVSLGGSCALLGDEPAPASGDGTDPADGSGSVVSGLCHAGRRPGFWLAVAGPDTSTQYGDRYSPLWCPAHGSGCAAATGTLGVNSAGAPPLGESSYFLRLHVRRPVSRMSVQLFDPAFVAVGRGCTGLPRTSATDSAWPGADAPNPYVRDARRRYSYGAPDTTPAGDGAFCTGDESLPAPSGVPAPVVTTVALRSPGGGGDPWGSPVVARCVRQYPGWALGTAGTTAALTGTDTGSRALQRLFRQWSTVCTIPTPAVGDWVLQVRTDLALGSVGAAALDARSAGRGARGAGVNRFAARVVVPGDPEAVTVSGLERMAVFANMPGRVSSFLLARVASASAGATLRVTLFDVGDALAPATVRVVGPRGARVDCTALGDPRGSPAVPLTVPGCLLAGVSAGSGFDSRAQHLDVAVPSGYSCDDADPTACWFRVEIDYPSSAFDTSTWSADLAGDPVRLVR